MQSIPSSAITDKIHAKPELTFPFVSNFQNAFPQWTGVMFHSRKYPGKCVGCLLGMQRYCSFYPHLRPVRKRAYCASCGQYLLTHPYRRKRPIPFKQAWGLWHRNRLQSGRAASLWSNRISLWRWYLLCFRLYPMLHHPCALIQMPVPCGDLTITPGRYHMYLTERLRDKIPAVFLISYYFLSPISLNAAFSFSTLPTRMPSKRPFFPLIPFSHFTPVPPAVSQRVRFGVWSSTRMSIFPSFRCSMVSTNSALFFP